MKSGGTAIFGLADDTFTEEYRIYNDTYHGQVIKMIFDVRTGRTVPFCFDVACEHIPSDYKDEDDKSSCVAYDFGVFPIYLNKQCLYYIQSDGLYSANLQGENRKLITQFQKPYSISSCIYTDEAAYIAYTIPYDILSSGEGKNKQWFSGQAKEKPEAGVLRVPYSGEAEEVIYASDEYYDMQIAELWYHNGNVSFQVIGLERPSKFTLCAPESEEWKSMVEEERKHTIVEALNYSVVNKSVSSLYRKQTYCTIYFFSDVYGILTDNMTLELYRYNGEFVAETEISLYNIYRSDHGIYACEWGTRDYVLLSQDNGKELKREFKIKDFVITAIVGKSIYGVSSVTEEYVPAYISEDDFWNGNTEGMIEYSFTKE